MARCMPSRVLRRPQRRIALQGCFVFGLDHDTEDVFQETAELAVDIGIDLPRFAIVTPFPGTALYRQMESEDRILTRNWSLYDGQHVVVQPRHMSPETLLRGNELAWKYAYRWRSIARRLRHTGAPLLVAITTNLGYRYYAHRLDRFDTCDWMTGFNPLHRQASTAPPAETMAAETMAAETVAVETVAVGSDG